LKCRFCNSELSIIFLDLVNSPPSNSYLTKEQLNEPEIFYPLKIFLCDNCFLVQIDEYKKSNEIFNDDYVYFSSYSSSWLHHAKNYVDKVIRQFNITQDWTVIEIASNDGYLLQYFQQANIPCLGIEPSLKTAVVAKGKGIDVIEDYFGTSLAMDLKSKNIKADLLIGNNVLAHVPDINDFVKGLKIILSDTGVITMEFSHLMQIIKKNLFDTIYHEHFSYLSFLTVQTIFDRFGLEIFDVEEISSQGGSLRIYAKHVEDKTKSISKNVEKLKQKEFTYEMNSINYYKDFQRHANTVKSDLLTFLIENKRNNKKIIAYGAAAKGNTLLNYCGIRSDLIEFVVDISPYKQGKYLPGSHIPIVAENEIKKYKPDYILILPWNIKEEIMKQLDYVNEWGCKFVIPLPEVRIL